jgi:hypothetical protein
MPGSAGASLPAGYQLLDAGRRDDDERSAAEDMTVEVVNSRAESRQTYQR